MLSLSPITRYSLARSSPRQHRRNGFEKNLEIENRRPRVDVLEIHRHPAVEVHLVAAGNLPQTGDPRAHRESPPLPRLVARDFLGKRGAGTDEAHVAADHVPELRQLVDRKT